MDKAITIQGTSQEMLNFQLTLSSVWVVVFFFFSRNTVQHYFAELWLLRRGKLLYFC